MSSALEYHISVRRLFSPAVALIALSGAVVFLSPSAIAQINAPPASVTSPGFGGRSVNGTASSVTSVGPRGYIPKTSSVPHAPINDGHQHRHRNGNYTGPYWYAVPYGVDPNAYAEAPEEQSPDDEGNYQGGPTVFDRRGAGARSYIPPVEDVPPPHAEAPGDQTVSAADPAPLTMLIFKDGHKLEIGNYAIVGSTLFDLTPGHSRRIPLADLNLDATKKENDDRGIVFEVPSSMGS